MKTRNDCEIACDCVKRANVVFDVGLCKEISQGSTQLPTSRHLLSPSQPLYSYRRDIHTYIHLTRSLVAWSPAGLLRQTKAPKLLSDWTSASISEKVNIS